MNIHIRENPRYKWEVSALLWIAFFLNQADRQVYNVVLPLIQTDLHLTDVQAGAVTTLFNLFYAVLVPFAGYAGDVFSKKWIVVSSILFWSIATMFTGLSNGLLMLIIMRSFATGGGESFFGPSCYSLLGVYHKKTRSFAMSVHQVSYYLGVIATGFLAGYIGEKYGWRSVFYIFGVDWFISVPAKITRSGHQFELKLYEDHFYKADWEEFDKLIEAA
jgi:MFS transporter, Spinster family, sphingosine-1-phosphate transporter